MFGYQEPQYDVVRRQNIVRYGHETVIEIRQPVAPPPLYTMLLDFKNNPAIAKRYDQERASSMCSPCYMVLELHDGPMYLEYVDNVDAAIDAQEANARLELDWTRLCKEPDVPLEELHWSERIQHDMGYARNGMVSMY